MTFNLQTVFNPSWTNNIYIYIYIFERKQVKSWHQCVSLNNDLCLFRNAMVKLISLYTNKHCSRSPQATYQHQWTQASLPGHFCNISQLVIQAIYHRHALVLLRASSRWDKAVDLRKLQTHFIFSQMLAQLYSLTMANVCTIKTLLHYTLTLLTVI